MITLQEVLFECFQCNPTASGLPLKLGNFRLEGIKALSSMVFASNLLDFPVAQTCQHASLVSNVISLYSMCVQLYVFADTIGGMPHKHVAKASGLSLCVPVPMQEKLHGLK